MGDYRPDGEWATVTETSYYPPGAYPPRHGHGCQRAGLDEHVAGGVAHGWREQGYAR